MRASRYILPLLLATSALAVFPAASFAQVACGPSVTTADAATTAPIAPPALPDYDQPPIPAPGYIWTPGYWGYADAGYYWVPGTWVQPPTDRPVVDARLLGLERGVYAWNAGYWGLTVGFYGGIDYGFGYGGVGYDGGYWDHGHFAYNRTVNNFGGVHITNVYNRTVINNDSRRISYNGGTGGLTARPTAQQEAYAHEHHLPPTREQTAHVDAARGNRSLLATENHRHPPIAATQRPGDLHTPGAVAARQAAQPQCHRRRSPAAGTAERAGSHRSSTARHGNATRSASSASPAGARGSPAGRTTPAGARGGPAGSATPAGARGSPAGRATTAGARGGPAGNATSAGARGSPAGSATPAGARGSPAGNAASADARGRSPSSTTSADARSSPAGGAASAGARGRSPSRTTSADARGSSPAGAAPADARSGSSSSGTSRRLTGRHNAHRSERSTFRAMVFARAGEASLRAVMP